MKEIYFTTQDIEDYLWNKLVRLGYAVNDKELDDISNIVFDYIIEKLGGVEDDSE